jgi:hypothetical protein
MAVEVDLRRAQDWLVPYTETKSKDIKGGGRRALLVPWTYVNSASSGTRVKLNPGHPSEQDKLDYILAAPMRNQECESKAIKKLLDTRSQEMANVRKETEEVKETLQEICETIRGVIKEFKKMDKTIEKWELWQQEDG